MALRLAKLPDRTPVKLTMTINPALHRMLQDYAMFYAKTYGTEETVGELCPFMLQAFMEADKSFQKARKSAATTTEEE